MPRLTHRAPMIVAGLVLLSASAVQAQKPDKSKDKQAEPVASATVIVSFTTAERRTISDYFARHPYQAKPLPPGIAKNFGRGKPLPPGIAKQQLPPDLLKALPGRSGVQVSIVADKVVLLEASGVVVDILEGLFH